MTVAPDRICPNHKALLGQPPAQERRHDGGVDAACFQSLAKHRNVTDYHHLDVIPFFLHAEVFKPNRSGFPYATADTLNAEAFTAQVFWIVDSGAGYQIQVFAAAKTGQDL